MFISTESLTSRGRLTEARMLERYALDHQTARTPHPVSPILSQHPRPGRRYQQLAAHQVTISPRFPGNADTLDESKCVVELLPADALVAALDRPSPWWDCPVGRLDPLHRRRVER